MGAWGPGRLAAPALGHRGEDALHEGGEVVGGPAGDQVAVADARLVLPEAAGVLHIVADREETRHLAALQALRRAEHPGTMADRGEALAVSGRLRDQVHHRRVSA